MLRLLPLLIAVFVFSSCKTTDKKNTADSTNKAIKWAGGKVTISGNIAGSDSILFELIHQEKGDGADSGFVNTESAGGDVTKKDTLQIANGKFTYTAQLTEPTQFVLRMPNASSEPLIFFADPGSVTINGSIDSIEKSVIKGGATQDEYKRVVDSINTIYKAAEPAYEQYAQAKEKGDQQTMQNIRQFFESLTVKANQFSLDYAMQNKGSLVSATLLGVLINSPDFTDRVANVYGGFTDEVKNSMPGKGIKKSLDLTKSTMVGAVAKDFTQNDVNGKPVMLSSLRGKYLLVDFWASWCGPCRQENPNVVAAYAAFKNKGFDILGVSLDDDKANWLKAIAADKLTWHHVSDLKGWKNEAAQAYRINSIPANLLLDKDGKIIAKDLRGEDLLAKLKQLMP